MAEATRRTCDAMHKALQRLSRRATWHDFRVQRAFVNLAAFSSRCDDRHLATALRPQTFFDLEPGLCHAWCGGVASLATSGCGGGPPSAYGGMCTSSAMLQQRASFSTASRSRANAAVKAKLAEKIAGPNVSQATEAAGQPGRSEHAPNPAHGLPTFETISAVTCPHSLTRKERIRVQRILRAFQTSAEARDRALALYVNSKLWRVASSAFRKFMNMGMTEELRDVLLVLQPEQAGNALFPLFARFVLQEYRQHIQSYREEVVTADLRAPHRWYAVARALRRRLVYHAGPTNSGKTFSALQALRGAASGVYCGPLRLLAMEVYDALNQAGTFCNLLTGQEHKEVPGAEHTACTVEMASLTRRWDVAVIDEVQGLPANEVHLCGDGSALPLVGTLAEAMGEPLEVRNYERFTPLLVEPEGLPGGYSDVKPGDCVVAFSRRAIYDIKRIIEVMTGFRVCVIYGALPPETRRQQARLFNEPGNNFDILVASDAVGLGLNLNIRRIIFDSLLKSDGLELVPISTSQIKQIAGRAGRRNSLFPMGRVTCLHACDVPRVQQALDIPLESLSTPAAGLFPEFEHIETFASKAPGDDFATLLRRFGAEARLDGTFFLCNQDSLLNVARLLNRVPDLSLQERWWFAMAPANTRSPSGAAALLSMAHAYAQRGHVPLDVTLPRRPPRNADELFTLESAHSVVSLWIWLANRFEESFFAGREHAASVSEELLCAMDQGLQHMYGAAAGLRKDQEAWEVHRAQMRRNRRRIQTPPRKGRGGLEANDAGNAGLQPEMAHSLRLVHAG